MIQTVCESCSVRWTKVNRKVYKFQTLVFNEDCENPTQVLTTSESKCQGHSKITAPTNWKQIYGEYLGEEYDPHLDTTSPRHQTTERTAVTDVAVNKKEQKRVHFEDPVKEQKEKQTNYRGGCLPDCYLCRRDLRKSSPPYQVLPEKSSPTTEL